MENTQKLTKKNKKRHQNPKAKKVQTKRQKRKKVNRKKMSYRLLSTYPKFWITQNGTQNRLQRYTTKLLFSNPIDCQMKPTM